MSLPRLRFPGFEGEWERKELTQYLVEHSKRVTSDTSFPIYSSTRSGLRPQKEYFDNQELSNDGEYGVVPDGFATYRHMSDDGTFKFNTNNTGGPIAVSKEYPVFSTLNLDQGFLLQLLNNGRDFPRFALAQKKGGTRTRLYLSTLGTWTPLLPAVPEQQKIATCLSSLDDLIAAEGQKLDALKAHKKGLMQRLFPREGETVPRLRFPEFRRAREWEVKSVGDVAEVMASGDLDLASFSEHETEEHPYPVYSNAVEKLGLYGFCNRARYPANSVTITARGTLGVAFFRPRAFVGIGRLLVLCGLREADPRFLCACWNLLGKAPTEVTSIPQFTAVAARSAQLPFPQVAEQTRIASFLSSLDEDIAAQAQKIDALKVHKKGLMQQLFPVMTEEE